MQDLLGFRFYKAQLGLFAWKMLPPAAPGRALPVSERSLEHFRRGVECLLADRRCSPCPVWPLREMSSGGDNSTLPNAARRRRSKGIKVTSVAGRGLGA